MKRILFCLMPSSTSLWGIGLQVSDKIGAWPGRWVRCDRVLLGVNELCDLTGVILWGVAEGLTLIIELLHARCVLSIQGFTAAISYISKRPSVSFSCISLVFGDFYVVYTLPLGTILNSGASDILSHVGVPVPHPAFPLLLHIVCWVGSRDPIIPRLVRAVA